MALLAGNLPGWRWWRLALLILLSLPGKGTSAQAKIQDYQVEAVYLFNFTQFVEWPSAAFSDAEKPIVIGVLGDDPFGSYLDETVRDEIVGNRGLIIRRYHRVEDIQICQVLFISRSEAGHLEAIIARLKDRSILTVSDADGFTQHGGIVHFVTRDDHIRLQINVEAARAAGLSISSKLLRVAETFASEKD